MNNKEFYIENIIKKLNHQFVSCGIDYKLMGVGSIHNNTVDDYVDENNELIKLCMSRQKESDENITEIVKIKNKKTIDNDLWELFLYEINVSENMIEYTSLFNLKTLYNILNYNLSMPLRCLNTCLPNIKPSYKKKIKNILFNLQLSLYEDKFVDFKFKSLHTQLKHLSMYNRFIWRYQYKLLHNDKNITTEGDDNFYMYFWATKFGNHKNSFDILPGSIYSLLCNARNKVIFLYNKTYNDFVGHAQISVLQTENEAILWLDKIYFNEKYVIENERKEWKQLIINHAYTRSKLLKIKLVIPWMDTLPKEKFEIILDPSDGLIETKSMLYENNNNPLWIQDKTEIIKTIKHVYSE